jgi:PAS domain S-box-containing protein
MIDKQQNSGQTPNDAAPLHKQAEEQARTIEPIALSAQTLEEIEQLIHDLQVHQIELKIQNEELRTALALTESKKVEDAQRESEEHFRSAFEHSAIGMALVSPEGKWLKVNNLVAKIVGYTADELMGKTFQDITHPEDLNTDLNFVRQMLAGEIETYQMEKRYIHKDGHIVWGLLAVSLIRDKRGTPRHFISQIQDITEQKFVEEALRKSEALLNATQSLSKVGGWEWNVETQTLYWTEETYRIHDFTPGEMEPGSEAPINRSVECYEPEARPVILAAFQRCVEEGQPYDLELPFTTATGRRLWIRTIARPVRESGKIIRVMGNIIDITELKRAEEALLAERKRLEFVIEGSRLGTWAWNVQTNEVIFSEAWAEMLGYTLEALTPTNVEKWIALTHPEDSKKAEALLALCLADETQDFNCEMRMKHKDGHWVWILTRGRIMTWDDTGKPLSMFGTHDDITDRKHREQQLAAALSEKEVLLREVHHRVKNNLAAIISLIAMQQRNLEDPNGQIILTELSDRIRTMSLVHEKLYRSDSLSFIDFHDYIQALVSHLRTTFGSPDIICRVDAPGVTIPLDQASPCGGKNMAKGRDAQKTEKKKSEKTLKEKRKEKKEKKYKKGSI